MSRERITEDFDLPDLVKWIKTLGYRFEVVDDHVVVSGAKCWIKMHAGNFSELAGGARCVFFDYEDRRGDGWGGGGFGSSYMEEIREAVERQTELYGIERDMQMKLF